MRKINIVFAAAIALCAAVSCQKESEVVSSQDGPRYVTLRFDGTATKTVLGSDGLTPAWQAGDAIRLLDEITYEDITLTEEDIEKLHGDEISLIFKTKLTGWPLYAVYPASATDMKVGIDEQVSIKIPTEQDGSFATANISVAMGDEDDMMVFRNATSVLKLTQKDAAVTGVKIEAGSAIAGECLVSFNEDGTLYNTMLKPGTTSSQIIVSDSDPQDCYYVAVAAKVTTGNTRLTLMSADGYAVASRSSKTLAANTIYDLGSIDDMGLEFKKGRGFINGHEYVQIGGLKWATENLALTASGKVSWLDSGHQRGDFIRWGELETLYDDFKIESIPSNDNEGAYTFNRFHEDLPGCPAETFWSGWENFNFEKINDKGNLTPDNDVVNKSWGGTWRMPQGGDSNDFMNLFNATYWVWDEVNYGCYVFEPDASHPAGTVRIGFDGLNRQDALLYFPATGWALSTAVSNTGFTMRQWTNHCKYTGKKKETVVTSFVVTWNKDEATVKKYNVPTDKTLNSTKYGWWLGYNIRPVSE